MRARGARIPAVPLVHHGLMPLFSFEGRAPTVSPTAWIAPTATLVGDVRVEDDGSLAYTRASIDPRTRERSLERTVVGRVALARFPAGGTPQRIDATHFSAVAGVVPHLGAPLILALAQN